MEDQRPVFVPGSSLLVRLPIRFRSMSGNTLADTGFDCVTAMYEKELLTVSDLLDSAAKSSPDAEVVLPEARIDYKTLADKTLHWAKSLSSLGVHRGDHVALITSSPLESITVTCAVARIGAVTVPINHRLKRPEYRYLLRHANPAILITSSDVTPEFIEARKSSAWPNSLETLVGLDTAGTEYSVGMTEFLQLGETGDIDEVRRTDLDSGDPAILMYTSGTTSNPKGCLHSHASLVREGVCVAERLGLAPSDRFWTPLPFHHCGGFDALVACLASGCTLVHSGAFDATRSLHQLYSEYCTIAFPAFETIWLPILEHPEFDPDKMDVLRVVVNVGSPERMREMQEKLPNAVQISCMGSTESNGFCCLGNIEDSLEKRCTTSGVPLPHMEARIVDVESGNECVCGEPGEFLFRGASRLTEYYKNAEETAAQIDSEGWFHSKDLAKRDEGGRLSFVCRMSDVLKIGGENVAAAEIEDYLIRHPSIRLAQVVPAHDEVYGEVAAAYVELHPGRVISGQEVIDFCLGSIATYKVPRYVRFVNEWPMSGTKIKKHVLHSQLVAELAEAGITRAPKMSSTAIK